MKNGIINRLADTLFFNQEKVDKRDQKLDLTILCKTYFFVNFQQFLEHLHLSNN